jgi:HicA toxin of bacterial toxin-antitoxin,
MGQKNLPLASGEDHARAFERCGWKRRKTASHIILTREGYAATLSIPNHKQVKRGLVQAQIRTAGLTEAEYLAAFHA